MSIWRTLISCAALFDAVSAVGKAQQQQRSDVDARHNWPANLATRKLGPEGVQRREILPQGDGDKVDSIFLPDSPKTPDSVGIAQDGEDETYFIMVEIGSNKKIYKLLIDSGSTNTWIAKDTCQSPACTNGKLEKFGPADSESLKITEGTFSVLYGTGLVAGVMVKDVIRFAGLELAATFGLATAISDHFEDLGIDGVLGLGPDVGLENPDRQTIMNQLKDQKLIDNRLYGVAFSHVDDESNDGVINFGAVDDSKFTGELKFMRAIVAKRLWELPVDSVRVGGVEITYNHNPTAVVDTGSDMIFMPQEDCEVLHAQIPNATFYDETFLIPCNTTLPLQLIFSDVGYIIPAHDYIGDIVSTPDNPSSPINGFCISLISPKISLGGTWLFGRVFLKNVYSVFDLDNRRVGFAPRKRTPSGNDPRPKPTTTTSGADVEAMTLVVNLVDKGLSGDAGGAVRTIDIGGETPATATANLVADNGSSAKAMCCSLMVVFGLLSVYMAL